MIRVCDAIMGQGKTTSAITYMKEHPDWKFIYITPYLEEAKRIRVECEDLKFVEPEKLWSFDNSKVKHTEKLVVQGKNIATTHQAFKMYTPETLQAIRDHGYTLIIDESIELLEACDLAEDDLNMLIAGGYIEEKDNTYTLVNDDYDGRFNDVIRLMKTRQITRVSKNQYGDEDETLSFYYWILSPELITSFKNVFILTYLFDGQTIHHFLEMYNLPYQKINIARDEDEHGGYTFRFSDTRMYIPEYITHMRDMIDILDNNKLNAIGEPETALSKNWFANTLDGVEQLKKNIFNVFTHIWNESEAANRMWATFKDKKQSLSGNGYATRFTVLNQRATNELRDKLYLVYACNLYMNVNDKIFFQRHGLTVDEDKYALSIMVQWIWRSAIRDGQKIHLYLPSSRMRRILTEWMDSLAKGGEAD